MKDTKIQNNIRKLRLENNLTQTQLGKEVGVVGCTFYRYEKSIYPLTDEVIIKLSKFFGVSTDYLLGVSDIRNPY